MSETRNFISIFFFFLCIFEIYIKFWAFSKERTPSKLMYFGNYGLRKTCLNKCLKNPVSQDTSASGMVNRNKHCSNLEGSTFSIVIDHCGGRQLDLKKCLLVIWKVLIVFVKALTACDKYSLRNRDNLTQPIEMQLSEKQDFLFNLFLNFWNLH